MTSVSLADPHRFEWPESEVDALEWKEKEVFAAAAAVVVVPDAVPTDLLEQRPYW